MDQQPKKRLKKIFLWAAGAILLAVLIFYGPRVYRNISEFRSAKNAEMAAKENVQKDYEELKRLYEEDTYGGKTPEETLALFIDALKKGDTDLAAKYFVIEEQEKQKTYLDDVKAKNDLLAMATDAQKLKLTKNDGERAFFVLTNGKRVVIVQVVLAKNSQSGIWKIIEL